MEINSEMTETDREELPDREELIGVARGYTLLWVLEIHEGDNGWKRFSADITGESDRLETEVTTSRTEDIVTLLERDEVVIENVAVTSGGQRGERKVTNARGLEPITPPEEYPFMLTPEETFNHIARLDARIPRHPDEALELLDEWGIEEITLDEKTFDQFRQLVETGEGDGNGD